MGGMHRSGIEVSNLSEFIDSAAIANPREINEVEIPDWNKNLPSFRNISFSLAICASCPPRNSAPRDSSLFDYMGDWSAERIIPRLNPNLAEFID